MSYNRKLWKYANVPCGHCGAVTAQRVLDGEAFRVARKRAGVSLCEMAKMAGISAAYLSDIERGQRVLRPGKVADRLVRLPTPPPVDPDNAPR